MPKKLFYRSLILLGIQFQLNAYKNPIVHILPPTQQASVQDLQKDFLDAVYSGNLSKVQNYLDATPNLANAKYFDPVLGNSVSALLLALQQAQHYNKKVITKHPETHELVWAKHPHFGNYYHIVKLLMEKSGNPKSQDANEPLVIAAAHGMAEFVDLFLSTKGAQTIHSSAKKALDYANKQLETLSREKFHRWYDGKDISEISEKMENFEAIIKMLEQIAHT